MFTKPARSGAHLQSKRSQSIPLQDAPAPYSPRAAVPAAQLSGEGSWGRQWARCQSAWPPARPPSRSPSSSPISFPLLKCPQAALAASTTEVETRWMSLTLRTFRLLRQSLLQLYRKQFPRRRRLYASPKTCEITDLQCDSLKTRA